MKLTTTLAIFSAAFALSRSALALPIPSDGSDGNFSPASDIEVDLSQAITGAWDANNSANTGQGRYDATKWAVVFKYASVNIPAGVTVTFKNHSTHAPVVWLVNGNVNIAGTVSVRGKSGTADSIMRLTPSEPGPGGFRGGANGRAGGGTGFGPGSDSTGAYHYDGGYGTVYGNPQIVPLIGGSGGSGYSNNSSGSGAGGAILVAAAGTIAIGGTIDARGGLSGGGEIGSSGAIRLIGEQVLGNGTLIAINDLGFMYDGAPGRIRVETSLLSTGLVISPNTIAVPPPATPVIWPASNAPTARIVSVDGVGAATDPTSPMISAADVGVQNNGNVDVIIQTTNFPNSGNVGLRVVPKYAQVTIVNAVYVSGTFTQANWKATLTFNPGFSGLQAIATVP